MITALIIALIVGTGLLTFSLARISTISEKHEEQLQQTQELERQACAKRQ